MFSHAEVLHDDPWWTWLRQFAMELAIFKGWVGSVDREARVLPLFLSYTAKINGWKLEMMFSNRNLLFQGSIFRFHVCFGGGVNIPLLDDHPQRMPEITSKASKMCSPNDA